MDTPGERIKYLRCEAELSRKELAGLIGVTPGAISNYELNKSKPVTPAMKNMVDVFGTTTEWILNGTGGMHPDKEPDELEQVSTVNSRIRWIRKQVGLSQSTFAARIGITQTGLSSLESGKGGLFPKVRPVVIQSISREFNVNEQWIMNGTGPIWKGKPEQSNPSEDYNLSPSDIAFIEAFIAQPKSARTAILQFVRDFVARDLQRQ